MTSPSAHSAAPLPRVSIVVPTHQRPESLRRLLDSLGQQTYPHELLEVLVVTSPKDLGERVAKRFCRQEVRFKVQCVTMENDPSGGKSAAAKRNHGVQLASGEWIAFIDDDCLARAEWIAAAARYFANPAVLAVEGRTEIPPLQPPTLTYKGLLSFTRPGGYQTCNMFYRRAAFLQAGGFDMRFPFYLEDSDLAWTFLERGHEIPFASDAVVVHPVSAPAPWRLLDDALRTMLLPLLRRKHPGYYRRSRVRALRTSHLVYLSTHLLCLGGLLAGSTTIVGAALLLLAVLIIGHDLKLFWGCTVRFDELVVTTLLISTVPIVRLVQILRGTWRYRILRKS